MATKQTKPTPAKRTTPASALPTTATAKATAPATPQAVALRGGAAVAQVRLTGKPYRTAAPHNQLWWQAITSAATKAGDSPVAVSTLVVSQANPQGVPAHFVGYALRRGYLQAA